MKIPEVKNSEELVSLACLIEESGREMYQALAGKTSDKSLSALFLSLAEEEEKHREMFLSLKSRKAEGTDTSLEEGPDLFDTGRLLTEISHIGTAEDLLGFAIRRELDTILFYKRMAHTGFGDTALLEKMIKMEETHFYRLHEVKEKL
ncbi:ferritin family protein [Candidatus Mcinerneyibacteriota bacterium]|nr:ferritin family protein [Candidatus Mcinerneyibacteriota bacterium]